MAADKEYLIQQATLIRDEHRQGANTAHRVGSLLLAMINAGADIDALSELFLRKDKEDVAQYLITFLQGLVSDLVQSANFSSGELGSGFVIKNDENGSYMEIDRLLVRKIAYFIELFIKRIQHVGGSIVLSPASMRCSQVEEFEDFYRCYFNNERDGQTINQEFVVGDQARCQTFNVKGGDQNVGNRYYWRLVVAVGDDYIDLSKTDFDTDSQAPLAGDEIVQLGNRDDAKRQNAIILSTIGEDAPSIKLYKGICDYSLNDKEEIVISPNYNKFVGQFKSSATGKDIDEMFDEFNTDLNTIKTQADRQYTIWFFEYEPTLENVPACNWSEQDKINHESDIFYYSEAGLAWRFVEGQWKPITDKQTLAALEKAKQALQEAEQKMQNFIIRPDPPYRMGDRWCNAVYPVSGDDRGAIYDNDDLVCVTSRAKGEQFSIDDWKPVSGTDSTFRKVCASNIEQLANRITTEVGAAATKEYAESVMRAASAAAQAAADALTAAEGVMKATGTSITQTGQYVSTIAAAFETDEDGNLVLDDNGKPKITKEAGSVITDEMAKIYAKSGDVQAAFLLRDKAIDLRVKSDDIINSINVSTEGVTIDANKINLNGAISANETFFISEKGDMTCTGGTIAGFKISDNTLTSEGDVDMTISSDNADGLFPSIRWGVSGIEYSLLGMFNNSGYLSGMLQMASNSSDQELALFIPSLLRLSTKNLTVELSSSQYGAGLHLESRLYSGKSVSLGLNGDRIRFYASSFPTKDQAVVGEVYNDNGTLKWKQS